MNINCHFVYGAAVGSMLALNIATISNAIPNITQIFDRKIPPFKVGYECQKLFTNN